MLVIRRPQVDILAIPHEQRLRDRLQHHLREQFPDQCTRLEGSLEDVVEAELVKARGYGLRSERDLCKYLNLVIVFGTEFDQTPWASRVLSRADRGPTLRINQLYGDALDRIGNTDPLADELEGAAS
jgi:hypothetical protein